ncbi:MAG: M28 family peptidase [Gammaproteobacteria bacterium]|nr:M28 family peptidase [Gammaproteobacteria bacterium]
MHRLTIVLSIHLSLVALLGCQPQTNRSHQTSGAEPQINTGAIQAHIEFLAHDLLEGRDTGSRGYDIAAQYVVSQFKQMGLKPAGDGDSYLQEVRFRQRDLILDKATLTITDSKGETTNLELGKDFVTSGSSLATQTTLSAPLVFVGYGISQPDLGHDDYENVDVKDKIVLVLNQSPKTMPSEQAAHFSSRQQRAQTAADRGAIGLIYLQTPEADRRFSFERMTSYLSWPGLSWLDKNGQPGNSIPQIKGGALLDIEASTNLFKDSNYSFEQLIELADQKQPVPAFALDSVASIMVETKHSETTSDNVAGIVEGTDPQLKNEYVVYSAHLDHIGVHHDSNKDDTVNNGALDNASGTAIMLETARLFAQNPPKRSILFIAVTGEEKGLLGSDFYAQNPTVPIDQLIANINLDMPLILYPIGDVIAFGSEHSTMGQFVQTAAEKIGLQMSPDPMPEQNIFVRSDHYSFVKQGVPSVFLVPGFKSMDPSVDGGKIFQQFFAEHYHQPSDEPSLPIDYEAARQFTKVNYLIGEEIANSSTTPRWKENNFFGDTFGRQ